MRKAGPMTDQQIIDRHADRLCDGLDLTDLEGVQTLRLRLAALEEVLEAELEVIEAAEAAAAHIPDWIGMVPRRRRLTLALNALAAAWLRALDAVGYDLDPGRSASWARTAAMGVEARALLDRQLQDFLDAAKAGG